MQQHQTYQLITPETFDQFVKTDPGKPFNMLNLISFHSQANYPENHELSGAGITGKEAYRRYLNQLKPLLDSIGATVLLFGKPDFMLVGPQETQWDLMFVVNYPSVNSLVSLLGQPAYEPAVAHREAAIADYRLMRIDAESPATAVDQFLSGG